jgi:hypothetical protein
MALVWPPPSHTFSWPGLSVDTPLRVKVGRHAAPSDIDGGLDQLFDQPWVSAAALIGALCV